MKMDTRQNIYRDFQNAVEKEKDVKLSLGKAKTGLDNLAKFFELLWKFDQEDKQRANQIETKNYAI